VKGQLTKGAKHFEGQGGILTLSLCKKQLDSLNLAGLQLRNAAQVGTGQGEGGEPSEMTKKMVEEDHMKPSEAKEISQLPCPKNT